MAVFKSYSTLRFAVYSLLATGPASASAIHRREHHAHHPHGVSIANLSTISVFPTATPSPSNADIVDDVHHLADDLQALAEALGINLSFLFGNHPRTGTHSASKIHSHHPLPPNTLSSIHIVPTHVALNGTGHVAPEAHTTFSTALANITIHRTRTIRVTRTVYPSHATVPTAFPPFLNGTGIVSLPPHPTASPSHGGHFSLHMPIPISANSNSSANSSIQTFHPHHPSPSTFPVQPSNFTNSTNAPTPWTPKNSTNSTHTPTPWTPLTKPITLLSLCSNPSISTISLPLLEKFYGPNAYPSLRTFPGCTAPNPSQALRAPGLLNCTALGTEVQKCQKRGKKVLLTVLGASISENGNSTVYPKPIVQMPGGNITAHMPIPLNALPTPTPTPQPNLFTSALQADEFASTLWSLFGAGHLERADLRPLGPDAEGTNSSLGIQWVHRPLGEEVELDGFDVQMPRQWEGSGQAGLFGELVGRLKGFEGEREGDGGKYVVYGVSFV